MLSFEVVSSLPKTLSTSDLASLAKELERIFHIRSLVTITLYFLSEASMQTLNFEQRGKNRPTDVLSFATAEQVQRLTPRGAPCEWGDIVVCPTYAAREARRRGLEPREELIRLITHGALHLRGYDHAEEEEEVKMFALQEGVVARIMNFA